jgi:hypothetical protein
MLSRMQESALRRIHESGGDGRRHIVPSHAAVDIVKTIASPMASELSSRAQLAPTAAVGWYGGDQSPHFLAPVLCDPVERVIRLGRPGQFPDRVAYGPSRTRLRGKLDRTDPTREDDDAPPALRYPIVGRVEDFVAAHIAKATERGQEDGHPPVGGEAGHVLQHDRLRQKHPDEAQEVKHEVLLLSVSNPLSTVQPPHPGPTLARGASSEEAQLATRELERSRHLGRREFPDIHLPNAHTGVIRPVGFNGERIILHSSDHVEPGLIKA